MSRHDWRYLIPLCVVLMAFVLLSGCGSLLPMHDTKYSQDDLNRAQHVLYAYDIPAERFAQMAHKPAEEFTFEVKMPCLEVVAWCSDGADFLDKINVPVACVKTWLGADKDAMGYTTGLWRTRISYTCDLTPEFIVNHERKHLNGKDHL